MALGGLVIKYAAFQLRLLDESLHLKPAESLCIYRGYSLLNVTCTRKSFAGLDRSTPATNLELVPANEATATKSWLFVAQCKLSWTEGFLCLLGPDPKDLPQQRPACLHAVLSQGMGTHTLERVQKSSSCGLLTITYGRARNNTNRAKPLLL